MLFLTPVFFGLQNAASNLGYTCTVQVKPLIFQRQFRLQIETEGHVENQKDVNLHRGSMSLDF